eukprot:2304635-Amphidinium_carterae.3
MCASYSIEVCNISQSKTHHFCLSGKPSTRPHANEEHIYERTRKTLHHEVQWLAESSDASTYTSFEMNSCPKAANNSNIVKLFNSGNYKQGVCCA